MKFFRKRSFQLLCALFALFVVGGDLVADSLHDATGACVTESQTGDHASCPVCGCSLHGGAALGADFPLLLQPDETVTRIADRSPLGINPTAAEIDHPPQLA